MLLTIFQRALLFQLLQNARGNLMDIWKLIAKTYLRVEIWATFLPHAGEHIIYYQAGRI